MVKFEGQHELIHEARTAEEGWMSATGGQATIGSSAAVVTSTSNLDRDQLRRGTSQTVGCGKAKMTSNRFEDEEQQTDNAVVGLMTVAEGVEAANAEVRDRPYCQHCRHAVRGRDYEHKFIRAGGCLAGPFCSWDCMMGWLVGDDDRIGDDWLEHEDVAQAEISRKVGQ